MERQNYIWKSIVQNSFPKCKFCNLHCQKVELIKAPVKVGDIVGYLEVISDGKVLKKIDITVVEGVKKANLWDLYK